MSSTVNPLKLVNFFYAMCFIQCRIQRTHFIEWKFKELIFLNLCVLKGYHHSVRKKKKKVTITN